MQTAEMGQKFLTQFDNIAELHGNFYNSHLAPQTLRTAVQAGIQCVEYLRSRPEVQGLDFQIDSPERSPSRRSRQRFEGPVGRPGPVLQSARKRQKWYSISAIM